MSITLDGNGNSVPPSRGGPLVLTEAERIVARLYDCEISQTSSSVTLRVPEYLWQRLVKEARKLNPE